MQLFVRGIENLRDFKPISLVTSVYFLLEKRTLRWRPLKVYHKHKGSKAQALIWHSLDDKKSRWDFI